MFIYQSLYTATNTGSLIGAPMIAADAGHTVDGTVDWFRPTQATTVKLYQAGFVTQTGLPMTGLTLTAEGGLYRAAVAPACDHGRRQCWAYVPNATVNFFDSTGLTLPSGATATNPNGYQFHITAPGTFVALLPNIGTVKLAFTRLQVCLRVASSSKIRPPAPAPSVA